MKVFIVFLFLISFSAFAANDLEEDFAETHGGSDVGTGAGDLVCRILGDGKHVALPDGSIVPISSNRAYDCNSFEIP